MTAAYAAPPGAGAVRELEARDRMISGWLAADDCPDCGGPLLDTSTSSRYLVLDCPGCGYHATWHITSPDPSDDDYPAGPGDAEDL